MDTVYIILAIPHYKYGKPYVWKVFNSFEKAKSEMDKIEKIYKMEWFEHKLIYKDIPSLKYRFESFELHHFFVD